MLANMRVIAGTHRGRRLNAPRTDRLRPTSDRVREALFSILRNRLTNGRFLDLYAGTGAVGIEAVSRGATHVTSVESDRDALKLIQQNVQICQIGDTLSVRAQAVEDFLGDPTQWNGSYDIIFADPPYSDAQEFSALLSKPQTMQLFNVDSWLVIEHATRTTLPASLGLTELMRRYRYGDTTLSVYSSPKAVQP
ncbi:MAG: putative Ribosomal RNA small subunit methyltransferase D [Candidatus Nitrospira kreftii]|uniref:Putative Ribosomal RNA small subunit methyltransferase D n=1 Tax=Candidatus Nitrospira kreftii TaxID=2652173 RepID=A0A7S8IZC0_9BACT|nr:MAG: putative Ribosomal RNA small subunit methyltransferase D [Candidatus Nitrospira kreftii]